MNVLPASTSTDADTLHEKIASLLTYEGYLRWGEEGRRVLSTFSGHDAVFGGAGWDGWLNHLGDQVGEKVRQTGYATNRSLAPLAPLSGTIWT